MHGKAGGRQLATLRRWDALRCHGRVQRAQSLAPRMAFLPPRAHLGQRRRLALAHPRQLVAQPVVELGAVLLALKNDSVHPVCRQRKVEPAGGRPAGMPSPAHLPRLLAAAGRNVRVPPAARHRQQRLPAAIPAPSRAPLPRCEPAPPAHREEHFCGVSVVLPHDELGSTLHRLALHAAVAHLRQGPRGKGRRGGKGLRRQAGAGAGGERRRGNGGEAQGRCTPGASAALAGLRWPCCPCASRPNDTRMCEATAGRQRCARPAHRLHLRHRQPVALLHQVQPGHPLPLGPPGCRTARAGGSRSSGSHAACSALPAAVIDMSPPATPKHLPLMTPTSQPTRPQLCPTACRRRTASLQALPLCSHHSLILHSNYSAHCSSPTHPW